MLVYKLIRVDRFTHVECCQDLGVHSRVFNLANEQIFYGQQMALWFRVRVILHTQLDRRKSKSFLLHTSVHTSEELSVKLLI